MWQTFCFLVSEFFGEGGGLGAAVGVVDVALDEHAGHEGRSLLPIIDAMLQWGQAHMELFTRKYTPGT